METERPRKWSVKMTFIKFSPFFFSFLEFIFAGVAKLMAKRSVPRTDTELTTVERGQNVEAGQSSYTFSPSTFVFEPNRDNQPNGTGSKKASKQLESRRRRTRKHKRNWDFFLWLYLTKPKGEIF